MMVSDASRASCNAPPGRDGILYQDEAQLVTLLDLPRSIASAQGNSNQHQSHSLLSCEPLEQPYASTEPKTGRASQRVKSHADSLTESTEHEDVIRTGLEDIKQHYKGPWCLPRTVQHSRNEIHPSNRKRKADDAKGYSRAAEPTLRSTALTGVATATVFPASQVLAVSSTEALQNQCFLNFQCCRCSLHISAGDATYVIPPHSSFLSTSLSTNTSSLLSIALLSAAPDASSSADAGEFDLIVLDPPWPNRSARRAAAYTHASHIEDPFYGLGDILPQHLAASGFVACWITHAQATRDAVEASFVLWNVEIVEEWTWVKVTRHGEPVVSLGSQWRRGWEVLIIGRKRDANVLRPKSPHKLMRRLIVAVPDLHSRKPCLKELFEQVLFQHTAPRVLEVFARHLVAGWCSVGDEVLRFNWAGHWMDSEHSP